MNRIVIFLATLALASAVGLGQSRPGLPGPAASASAPSATSSPVPDKLSQAIAAMRNINRSSMSEKQLQARAVQLSDAWRILIQAGPSGTKALLAELDALDKAGQKDDYFRLGAAALLWQIVKTDHAARIAAIWSAVPVKVQYQYTFFTAMAAAETQDPRVLPMLNALLHDDKGVFLNAAHAMEMGWPMNIEFIWGAFGQAGLPKLREVLGKSKDPVELRSACHLLALAGDSTSLPRIRQLAGSDDADLRQEAVRALGWLGHPQDFDLLTRRLQAKDPNDIFSAVFALWEYGDCRASETVAVLLSTDNEHLREEVISCLERLASPAAIDALAKYAASKKDQQVKDNLEELMKAAGRTPAQWQASTPAQKDAAIDKLLSSAWTPGDDAAHAKLQAALVLCGKKGRLEQKLEPSAVRPEDLPLLLAARAAVCRRVSDEALGEIQQLNRLMQTAARIQYRANPRVCRRVEPATRPAATGPAKS